MFYLVLEAVTPKHFGLHLAFSSAKANQVGSKPIETFRRIISEQFTHAFQKLVVTAQRSLLVMNTQTRTLGKLHEADSQ